MAKYNKTRAWDETRDLLKEHRGSLTIGLILMVINRASGFVLPYTSKFLVDDIIGKHRVELLMPLAAMAVVVLFYINWKLTSATLVALILFGVMMTTAFKRLRPLFRERGAINADVTGRLTETIGGIRLVKVYTAEARERLVFARGAH